MDANWIADLAPPVMMIAPAVLAALIMGGGSIIGSIFGEGESHDPERIPDPYKDPMLAEMLNFFQGKTGQPKPAYPGQLTAGYNPALLSALGGAEGQMSGYSPMLGALLGKFSGMGGSGMPPGLMQSLLGGMPGMGGGGGGGGGGMSALLQAMMNKQPVGMPPMPTAAPPPGPQTMNNYPSWLWDIIQGRGGPVRDQGGTT